MSLYCKKCGKKTELIAEGLCVDCYRAMGYDSVISNLSDKESSITLVSNNTEVLTKIKNQEEKDKVVGGVYAGVREKLTEDKTKRIKKGFFRSLLDRLHLLGSLLNSSKEVSKGIIFVAVFLSSYIIWTYAPAHLGSSRLIFSQARLLLTDSGSGSITEEYDWREMDSDGDGLPDWKEETKFGTDPGKTDTDDDGITDYYEVFMNRDPLKMEE